jgi:hypothetical protein
MGLEEVGEWVGNQVGGGIPFEVQSFEGFNFSVS